MRERKARLICLMICIALAVSGCESLDSGKYHKAQDLFEQSSYAEAQTLFAKIESYEDSAKYLAYIASAAEADKGNFAAAADGFAVLENFRDSAVRAAYCAARQAEAEQRYEDAQPLYQQAAGYGDSAARAAALPQLIRTRDENRRAENYAHAQTLLNSGEYAEAVSMLEALSGYEESSVLLMYARAMELAEGGDYEPALYSLAALEDFRDSKLQVIYYQGRYAESLQKYEEAGELYQSISTFRDCAERLKALPDLILDREFASFREGVLADEYALEEEPLVRVIVELVEGKYSDSDTRMLEQYYQLGEEALANQLYENAFGLFEVLSFQNYRDSDVRMLDVIYAYAMNGMSAGNYYQVLWDLDYLAKAGYAAAVEPRNECAYQLGLVAEGALNYHQAYRYYQQAGEHKDSADRAARFETEYAAAAKLLEEGKYAEAAEAFALLHNYSDASSRVSESHYKHAEALMTDEKWEYAVAAFRQAGDYADAADRVHEPYYRKAEKLLAEEDWSGASFAFQLAGDYSDAADRVKEPYYLQGKKLLAEEKYEEAIAAFTKAGNQLEILRVYYLMAENALAEGKYEEASDLFKLASPYSDSDTRAKQAIYLMGENLLEQGKYEEARSAFSKVSNYSDAYERVLKIHYELAEKALAAGEYNKASSLFIAASTYSDAASRVQEPYYVRAEKLLAEGKTDEAIAAFAAISDYNNAKIRILMIHYDLAEAALAAGEYETACREYEAAAGYLDATHASAIAYVKACALLDGGNYEEAEAAFLALGDFRDSADKAAQAREILNSAAYDAAQSLLDTERYSQAEKAFLALGDYRDSADKAAEAYEIPRAAAYASAEQLAKEEKYLEASRAFRTLGEYSDSASRADLMRTTGLKIEYDKAEELFAAGEYEAARTHYLAAYEYEDAEWKAAYIEEELPLEQRRQEIYEKAIQLEADGDYENAYSYFHGLRGWRNSAVHAASCLINAGKFKALSSPVNGSYLFETTDGKCGIVNPTTGLLLDDVFDHISVKWYGEVAGFIQNERVGLVNTEGRILSEAKWHSVGEFFNGRARVLGENKLYGLINDDGTICLEPAYKSMNWLIGDIWQTGEGVLIIDGEPRYQRKVKQNMLPLGVKRADGSILIECDDGMWRNISSEGELLCESKNQLGASYGTTIAYLDAESGKWGLLNWETGEILIKPKYSSIWPFGFSGMTNATEENKNGKTTYDIIRYDGRVLVSRSNAIPAEKFNHYQYGNKYINAEGNTVISNKKNYSKVLCYTNGYIYGQKTKKTSKYQTIYVAQLLDGEGKKIWEKEDCALSMNPAFPEIGDYTDGFRRRLLVIDEQGVVHDDIPLLGDASVADIYRLDDTYVLLTSDENSDPPFRSVILDTKNYRVADKKVYLSINQPVFGPDKLACVMTGQYKSYHSNSDYTWKVITYGENGIQQVTYTAPDRSDEPIVLSFPAEREAAAAGQ